MKTKFLKYSIVLIALLVCIRSAHAQAIKHSLSSHSNGDYYMYVDDDSSVNPVQTLITYRKGGERYDIKIALDKIIELYVDNRKIPADSFYLYNGLIDKLKEQIKRDRIQAKEDEKQAELDRVQAKEDEKQAALDRVQAGKDQQQAEEDRKQALKDMKQSKIDQEQAEQDRKESLKEIEEAKKDKFQADEDRKQAEEDRKQAIKDQEQAKLDRVQAEEDRKQAEEDRALVKALITELVKENIIPNESSLVSLVLTDDEMVINGKKQSEELHAKFKAKFIKKPGYSVHYGGSTSGYGIFINNDDLKKKE